MAKEVEGELGLGKELIPEEWGKRSGHDCEDGEKLRLESLDHAFRYVAAVYIRENELESCFPLLFDLLRVGGAAFVVEDLKVDVVTVFWKADHDAVACDEAVTVVAGLEGINQDDFGVYVVGGHDEVVAA